MENKEYGILSEHTMLVVIKNVIDALSEARAVNLVLLAMLRADPTIGGNPYDVVFAHAKNTSLEQLNEQLAAELGPLPKDIQDILFPKTE